MTSNPPNIAILVLAHKDLGQVKRLVTHLQGDFDVFVHLDRRSEIHASDFEGLTRTTVIKKVKATWGSLGIVRSTLELLELSSRGGNYDRYVLVSGQDVPLRANEHIIAFFASHSDVDFVDSNPFTPADESRLTRISRFHFFPRRSSSPALTRWATNLSRHLDRLIAQGGMRRPMKYNFRWGSQWMDLRSGTVREVLEFLQSDPSFLKRFRFTFCPDEFFFQTAIEHCDARRTPRANPRRFIDWDSGPERPRVLRSEDLSRLADSDMLFARKCDPLVDSALIEALYARLSGRTDGQ